MINYEKLKSMLNKKWHNPENIGPHQIEAFVEILKDLEQQETEIQVKHPSHYNSHPSGVECIQVASKFDYCLGNAIKYRWRRGLKEGQPSEKEDAKAQQYLKFRKQYCPELGEELTIEDVDQIIENEINLIIYNQRKWK